MRREIYWIAPVFIILSQIVFSPVGIQNALVMVISDKPVWTCFHVVAPGSLQNGTSILESGAICAKPDYANGVIYVYYPSTKLTMKYDVKPGGNVSQLQSILGIDMSSSLAQSIGSLVYTAQHWVSPQPTATTLIQGNNIEQAYIPVFQSPTYTGYFGIVVDENSQVTLKYLAIDEFVPFVPVTLVGKEYPKEYFFNEPPIIKILEPANLTVVGGSFNLRFNATDPEGQPLTCQVIINNKQIINVGTVLSGEPVNVLVYPYIGKNYIDVICKDPYEAYGKASLIVIYEKPPVVVISQPKNNELIFNKTTYNVVLYLGDDVAQYLTCSLYLDGNAVESFTPTVNASYVYYSVLLYLGDLSAGTHNLKVNCTDQAGLSSYDQIYFDFATDADQLERACVELYNGEWYTDHCCGDDPGENKSTDAMPGEAFIPWNCSIIKLALGQCDDISDCPSSGWYCTNSTFREYREYYCEKAAGELIGNCTYTVTQVENCTTYGPDYFCSYGKCTNIPITPTPPHIEILYPKPYSTVEVPVTRKFFNITVKVWDDLSEFLLCNVTYDSTVENLGFITNGTVFNVTIPLKGQYPNATVTYSVTIACKDKENLTNSQTVVFNVKYTEWYICEVDEDCGIDHWECISSTQRAYYDYYCDNGECKVKVTAIETCPAGTYCVRGVCTPTLNCTTDIDCPADEWVCVNMTHREFRDWYCDTTEHICKYRVTTVEACPEGSKCVQGYCTVAGQCPPPTYICLDNRTKALVVWIYDNETYSCVGHMMAPEECPAGTMCLYGRCVNETKPEPNRPPLINWKGFAPGAEVEVGKPVNIVFTVSDDNSMAIFVKVTVAHSPEKTIFQGIVSSGQDVSVTYTPEEEGTYIVTAIALDGYSAQTIYQTSFTAVAPAAPAPAPAPAPTAAPAPAPAPGPAPAPVPTPGPTIPILPIVLAIGGVVAAVAIYFYMKSRGRWF